MSQRTPKEFLWTVFDKASIEGLLDCVDSTDPDFFVSLFHTFLEHTQKSFDEIEKLAASVTVSSDSTLLRLLVIVQIATAKLLRSRSAFTQRTHEIWFFKHALKGSSGSVGAMGLSSILSEMNVLGKSERYEEAMALWPRAKQEWASVKAAIPVLLSLPEVQHAADEDDGEESGSYSGSEYRSVS